MHDNGVRMSWTACSTICFHGSDSSSGLADILNEALRSGRVCGHSRESWSQTAYFKARYPKKSFADASLSSKMNLTSHAAEESDLPRHHHSLT
jgi:hypothetical protein